LGVKTKANEFLDAIVKTTTDLVDSPGRR